MSMVTVEYTAHSGGGGGVSIFGDIQDSALQDFDLPDLIRPVLSMGLK